MRFRLDAQHYIHDRLLEIGHIIGDGTDVPFRDVEGQPMVPSASMTPLNEEAMGLFKKKFPGAKLPPKSALDAIPLHEVDGQVQQLSGGVVETGGPGPWVIGPDGKPTNELKKGLPDSGSPNSPVGRPVIGTPPAPGSTPYIPPKPVADQGQPPGAPLKSQQAPQPTAPTQQPIKPAEPKKA